MGKLLILLFFIMLLALLYWIFYEPEPPRPQKKKTTVTAQDENTNETAQGEISQPERKPVTDDGMDPQERLIPYITQEPKQTPVKEQPPKFVFEKPKRHTLKTRDKKQDKERRGMER